MSIPGHKFCPFGLPHRCVWGHMFASLHLCCAHDQGHVRFCMGLPSWWLCHIAQLFMPQSLALGPDVMHFFILLFITCDPSSMAGRAMGSHGSLKLWDLQTLFYLHVCKSWGVFHLFQTITCCSLEELLKSSLDYEPHLIASHKHTKYTFFYPHELQEIARL